MDSSRLRTDALGILIIYGLAVVLAIGQFSLRRSLITTLDVGGSTVNLTAGGLGIAALIGGAVALAIVFAFSDSEG